MNKDSTKLILSRLINKFGNVLYDYANSAWIVSFSNFGKSYLGLYQLADSITLILFNPTAGVLADRINRKKILLITDFISAFMCLLLCLINNNSLMIILLIFNNVILSVCSAFSSTAMKSFTPNVVKNSEMLSFNSVLETFLQLINVLSPIFCVFFYKTLGLRWTLFFNALTFLLSFFLILNIKVEKKIQLSTEKITIPIIWMDLTEGYKYIKRDSEIFLLLIISAFVNLFLACYNYLLPFTNTIYNDTNSFAIFLTTGAIGAVIGAILSKHIKNNIRNLFYSLFLCGFGLILVSLMGRSASFRLWKYFGNLFFEVCLTIYNIHFISNIQKKVPDELLGRVFSTIFTVAVIFMPFGTTIMTIVNNSVSNTAFLTIGFCIIILSILGICSNSQMKIKKF